MSAGYGRGYYGTGQLESGPPRRRGGWVKIALVVGVGAAIWVLWPRKKPLPDIGRGGDAPQPSAPPPQPSQPVGQVLAPPSSYMPPSQVDPQADARGFSSQQAYEDAVVASARQLQDEGARVVLAPHLQHLTPRLGP